MADWYGAARTNYFPVKDAEAFKAWAIGHCLRPFADEASGLWGVYSEAEFGGWPTQVYGPQGDGPHDFDIVVELARHVPDRWPVVLMETGAEKLCYLTGHAVAFIVSDGQVERIAISLEDIHELAAQRWGVASTRCAY